jgi:hypothetical protein
VSIGNPTGSEPGWGATLETRVHRVEGSGALAPDWPAGGKPASLSPPYYVEEFGAIPDYSYRLLDGSGVGALAGFPQFALHSGSNVSFVRFDDSGDFDQWWAAGAAPVGYEIAGSALSGHYVASFYPTGPTGPYQPSAYLSVRHTESGFSDWTEYHTECCVTWYGDIGLAGIEDGGAVFLWSRVQSPVGLFARRFNPAGEVTAVEPGPPLAPRFEPAALRPRRGCHGLDRARKRRARPLRAVRRRGTQDRIPGRQPGGRAGAGRAVGCDPGRHRPAALWALLRAGGCGGQRRESQAGGRALAPGTGHRTRPPARVAAWLSGHDWLNP